MKQNVALTLALAFGALTGCATPVTPENFAKVTADSPIKYTPRTEGVRVHTDNSAGGQIAMDFYEGISTEEVEKQLVRLAQKEGLEEAFAYSTKGKRLFEIGLGETPFSTEKSVFPLSAFETGDHVILYHHHPLRTAAWGLPRAFPADTKDALESKLNSDSGIYSCPSTGDVDYLLRKEVFLSTRGISVETRIADHRMVTTVKLLPGAKEKLGSGEQTWRKTIYETQRAYLEGKAKFDTVVDEYKKVGVEVSYRKAEDVIVKALALDKDEQKIMLIHLTGQK